MERIKIYNSMGKGKEEFKPLAKHVIMYVCGLTPYDHAHVGYGRTCVAFDMIKRYLKHKGYSILHIQNITDVDDKILKRCKETGDEPSKLTERYHNEAEEALNMLGVIRADVRPKVTEHIEDIIEIIERLIDRGFAYETPTGIYFSVGKFQGYGKLSGQDIKQLQAGARIEVEETKKSPLDFALWKKAKNELLEFDSPWGKGRPGWHIECSAMNAKHAGHTLDIHGGARDLIFPHHENEIAQSEAAFGRQLAKYWMHTGLLTVQGEKMSKSLGNFVILVDAVKKFGRNPLRMLFLQTHYRSPIDYSEEQIEAMQESVERVFNSLGLIREKLEHKKGKGSSEKSKADKKFREETKKCIADFYTCMDDDFDTPNAIATLFNLLHITNQHLQGKDGDSKALENAYEELQKMLWIVGIEEDNISIDGKIDQLNKLLLEIGEKQEKTAEKALQKIIDGREELRKKKEFAKSDEIRKKLAGIGIILEDKVNEKGVRWKLE